MGDDKPAEAFPHPAPAGRLTGHLLVVDDEPHVLRAFERVLRTAGHRVETAQDGLEAAERVRSETFDVILSDIAMPGMDGLGLLKVVRSRDLDVPVILVTGGPAMETVLKAMESGAMRYLVKPVDNEVLLTTVQQALRLHEMARLKRQAVTLLGSLGMQVGDRAGLEAKFIQVLDTLWMAFQPIVEWNAQAVFAYEALLRAEVPALPEPGSMLSAAERLDRLPDLGRSIRSRVAETLNGRRGVRLFVNLHPKDLLDPELYNAASPLSKIASDVVLEITERAALDGLGDVRERVRDLRALGYRLAVDDLGAGYAGLSSFALLEPEFVKIDLSLTEDIDRAPLKQKLVRSMAALCRDMGIRMVAEGVERAEQRDRLIDLGCDLLQGFLFGRPARGFSAVTW